MTRRVPVVIAAAGLVVAAAAYVVLLRDAAARRSSTEPLSPEQSRQRLQVADGFRVEIVATEPMIASPVAMDIDEDGRIFVVEMPGYPLDTSASGRIKLLEDRDGDGRIDTSRVFADNLVLPTGVMRWKRGILVTAAPEVLYLEDRDRDGRADVREVVLTGFAFTNPQHTVNTPLYGLDNWIYLAHEGPAEAIIFKEQFGDLGGPIRFPQRPQAPVDAGRRSVRFRPATYQLEALAGRSQFGHAFDAWGRYFTLDNSNHSRHEVIASRYVSRNPDLPLSSAMQNISDHGAAATVFPLSSRPRLELLSEPGQFTSACGLTIDLGGRLSQPGTPSVFVAEPVHNVVHRDLVSPAGSTFVARRAEEGREFLASSDPWFRPVNFYIGPDGSLFVIDYYREMIEHPEWTASEHHHHSPALFRGQDRGRIYRVVPDGNSDVPAKPRLGAATLEDLVSALAHANGWWRRTAQRLLVDRADSAAVPLLAKTAESRPSPEARVHALWTLDALGALDPALIERALGDDHPGVRENAIRLAETRLQVRPLEDRLLAMTSDPDQRVRFQLLCTLGFVDTPRSRAAQQRLLAQNVTDDWMQVAALSAGPGLAIEYFDRLATGRDALARDMPAHHAFLARVTSIVGARGVAIEVERVIAAVAAPGAKLGDAQRVAALDGLARGVRAGSRRTALGQDARGILLTLFETSPAAVRRGALGVLQAAGLDAAPRTEQALARALDTGTGDADAERRADAVALLSAAGPDRLRAAVPRIQGLVDPRQPEAVQLSAVRALGASDSDAIAGFLIGRWRDMPPAVRSEAADALLRRPARTRALLDALTQGSVPAWTLSFWQKRDLLMHEDAAIRGTARALLEEKPEEQARRNERLDAALTLKGDPSSGERVFRETCSKCHVLNGVGAEVGPDLGTVRGRPASVLLGDILWPNRSIAAGFESYVIERASGGIEQGVLASQTPTSVVLRQEQGRERIVPRADIKRMYGSTLSAMPGDLDQTIGPQQLADLVAFLKLSRPDVDGR